MQIKKSTTIFLFLVSCFLLQGFLKTNNEQPLKKVKAQFEVDIEQFNEALSIYEASATQFINTPNDIKNLQKVHLQARLAYKNIEFLVEYIDPYQAKRNYNGAPLPTTEPAVPEVKVIQPVGLQVLDDIVFGDNPFESKTEISQQIAQLRKEFETARPVLMGTPLTHRHIFEAARRELIRIFTLGVTGFDTPGSANALPEASAAYEGLAQAIRCYLPLIDQKDKGLAIVIDARLDYTSTLLNPLYELILEMQKKLGIETIEEVETLPQPINYQSKGLFDTDFLNAGFYAKIKMNAPGIEQRIALGRLLFFDPILSKDNTMACASCHQPEKAFTDGLAKSMGRDGEHATNRNAPTLINCVYSEHFFHDMREPQLDRQVLHVVKNENEFASDYVEIIKKLNLSSAYLALFKAGYPNLGINPLNAYSIADALASYVASLQSFDSPFDDYVTGRQGVIDPAVVRGFNLFMGKAVCGTCHFAPVFNGTVPPIYVESESEVIGVPASKDKNAPIDADEGRYANQKPRDRAYFYQYSFKTPTVRNIAQTAPYMHNGVYQTLEEVVDFYNKGGGQGIGIKIAHQTLPFDNLQLSAQEQKDLVAFMKSLNTPADKFTAPESLPSFDGKPEWNERYRISTNKQ